MTRYEILIQLLPTPTNIHPQIVCHSTTTFIAHLVNQTVAHEIIALQILVLLLERPTDDSIEIAVGFTREVGAFLAENSPKANATVFERFRAVLNEGSISHRVQYMIEVLMQVRKDKYKDNPILAEGLDLVEEDDQITHQIQLEEELQVQEGLSTFILSHSRAVFTEDCVDIFKFDPKYMENEEKYKSIKAEILGDDSDEDEDGSEASEDEDDEEDGSWGLFLCALCFAECFCAVVESKEGIEDRTETNLVNLRRIIYLTIMNALNYEEAVHKLLKVQIDEGQEVTLTFLHRLYYAHHPLSDRNGEHDHRVLLSRTLLLYLLRSDRGTFLQAQPHLDGMLRASFPELLHHYTSVRNEPPT